VNASRPRVLVAVLLSTFANYFTITILTIALRPIAAYFEADFADTVWVTLGPLLSSGLLVPACGRLCDRYGRVRTFVAGAIVTTLGTLLSAAAPSLAVLVLARVLAGVGFALATPAGLALVTTMYDADERHVPVGYWTMITALAPALGVLVGGLLIEYVSWRWLFIGQVPFGIASLVLIRGLAIEQGPRDTRRFDTLGATLVGSFVTALTLALNRGPVWGFGSPRVLALFLLAAGLLAALVPVERDAAAPVIPRLVTRDHTILWGTLTRGLLNGVHMGNFVVLPLFLMDVAEMGPVAVSLALAPRPFAMGLAAPLASRLTAFTTPPRLTVYAAASMFVGASALVFLTKDFAYPTLLVSLVLMGGGLGFGQTSTGGEVSGRSPEEDLGAVSALLTITTTISGSIAIALFTALATDASFAPEAAFRHAFLACSALGVVTVASAARFARFAEAEAA
jgi:MFS family permease